MEQDWKPGEAMWVMLLTPQIACLVVGSPTSSASSCRTATSCSASAGHSRNQSIYVQLIKPAAHQHQAVIISISSSIEFCCSQLQCASLSHHQIDDVRVLPCRFVSQQMALMSVFHAGHAQNHQFWDRPGEDKAESPHSDKA